MHLSCRWWVLLRRCHSSSPPPPWSPAERCWRRCLLSLTLSRRRGGLCHHEIAFLLQPPSLSASWPLHRRWRSSTGVGAHRAISPIRIPSRRNAISTIGTDLHTAGRALGANAVTAGTPARSSRSWPIRTSCTDRIPRARCIARSCRARVEHATPARSRTSSRAIISPCSTRVTSAGRPVRRATTVCAASSCRRPGWKIAATVVTGMTVWLPDRAGPPMRAQ